MGAGLGGGLGEIPAASAGMTDLFRAGVAGRGAGVTDLFRAGVAGRGAVVEMWSAQAAVSAGRNNAAEANSGGSDAARLAVRRFRTDQ